MKLEDSKADYSFDLKESKKIKEMATFDQRGSAINTKRAIYEKKQAEVQKDPMSAMGGVSSMNGRNFKIDMDPNQRKTVEDRIKSAAAKNNNPIELK